MEQNSQKSSLFPWERANIPSFASLKRNQTKSFGCIYAFDRFTPVTTDAVDGQQKDICLEVSRTVTVDPKGNLFIPDKTYTDQYSLCDNQISLSSNDNELQHNNLEAARKSSNAMIIKSLNLEKSWPSAPMSAIKTTKTRRNDSKTPLSTSNSKNSNSKESIKQSELNRVNRLMRKQISDKLPNTNITPTTPKLSKSFDTPLKQQLREDISWSKYLTPIRPPATTSTNEKNDDTINNENLLISTPKRNVKSCFSMNIDDNCKGVMTPLQTHQIPNFGSSNADANTRTTPQDKNFKDIERQYEELVKEKANFEHYKNTELSEIKKKKEQELQIIEAEKKKWTKTRAELELAPSQRHIQEVDNLQKQICNLQYTLRHRENIHRIELERLKRRISELSRQNQELLKNQKGGSVLSLESPSKSKENYHSFHNNNQGSINNSCEYAEIDRSSITCKTVKFNLPPNPGCEKLDKLAKQIENIGTCVEEIIKNDEGKIERVYSNGTRLILFSNDITKEIRNDGIVIVRFTNGNIKEIIPHQKVTYFYTDGTVHTIFADGEEVVEYSNGQIERTHVDGTAEIYFPDNVVQYILSNGEAETVLPGRQAII
ncbi:5465_t:CDS:10 [Ambispora leptoticha]|uniref:5465_t:CDS:1 n=1 Tax=Ambispora leptoticha TaxID=144679 RepID=A0A9N9FSS3_9GLOM|nr:5465_t:CDS:10 [Ambispora leptoticha]